MTIIHAGRQGQLLGSGQRLDFPQFFWFSSVKTTFSLSVWSLVILLIHETSNCEDIDMLSLLLNNKLRDVLFGEVFLAQINKE